MQIDRTKINFMPLIRGPLWDQSNLPRHVYASQETLMLQYETDPKAIPPLLPEPFIPGKSPLVTVLFSDNNGVDFLAGGAYRLAVVAVAAQIDTAFGHLEGNYVLVMPENKTLPILTGRELLGMPKFYADISSIRITSDGHLRCEASLWGHLLFGIDLAPPFKNQNSFVRRAASRQSTKTPSFGYKYIASLDGTPDADYPTIMWTDYELKNLSLGKMGQFYFGNPTERDIGYFKPLLDALKTLSVINIRQAAHSFGSMVLRNDNNGRIS
jgi:acetoacetate decarboxylase